MGARGALSDHIACVGKYSKCPQRDVYKCLLGGYSLQWRIWEPKASPERGTFFRLQV